MSRKLRAMRDARERRRLEGVEPRYPRELPALRRTVIIIDYDFGRVEHRIDLYRTPRIDCWRAVARRCPDVVVRGLMRCVGFFHVAAYRVS